LLKGQPWVKNVATALKSPFVTRYLVEQRNRLVPRSVPLSSSARQGVESYFSAIDLAQVRIVISDALAIADPPFASAARHLGLDFPSVGLTAAITFDHVIACREPMTSSLLFHELVHVVQYRLLGVSAFATLYVRGFLRGGSYHDIPLECCAFELEHRFVTGNRAFSVEAEVGAWIDGQRF
jgi:hypothetical protein